MNATADDDEVMAKVADFAELAHPEQAAAGASLDFLADVPVTVSARLGQVVLPIGDVLKLGPGAVLELDRDVTQPVDLTVRGQVFARGEVVVVDGQFAVRVRELLGARKK